MLKPEKTDWISEADALDLLRREAGKRGVTRTDLEMRQLMQLLLRQYAVATDRVDGRTKISRTGFQAALDGIETSILGGGVPPSSSIRLFRTDSIPNRGSA